MSEQQDVDATSTDPTNEPASTTEPPVTDGPDEWQAKYQGQLKVNRDLEEKLKDAAGVARKKLEAEYAAKLKAELELKDKPAEEQALEAARAEARAEATSAANRRILRAELKALATGKFADPTDVLAYPDIVNLDNFAVSDDGEVNSDELTAAIAELLEKKPHLAAQKPNRFTGDGDQGAKGKDSKPAQMTRDDLRNLTPEQIVAAKAEGRLNDLLGITT